MKVSITGHTSGIGKALAEVFHNHIGFSRSNGFDISIRSVQDIIVEKSLDCDVFINNAYAAWSQIDLLHKFWSVWKDQGKTIVCIGSDSADYNVNFARPYNIHKRALEDACLQLQQSKMPCKVIHIKPSYIDTPRVAQIDAKKMNANEVAKHIKFLVELKGSYWVPNITLYPE